MLLMHFCSKLSNYLVCDAGEKVVAYMVQCCVKQHKMTERLLTAHVNKHIVPISRNALVDWLRVNRAKDYKPRFQNSQTPEQMIALAKWGEVHSKDHWIDCIHADEVWFYLYDLKGKYILLPEVIAEGYVDRAFLNHCVSSRGNISKIMYLIVVARPRPEYRFDGKLACIPVIEWRRAIRNSCLRPAGTWEMKAVSMDAPFYLQLFEEIVAPAIVEKMNWISSRPRHIRWQDDNASSHCKRDMVERLQEKMDLLVVANMPGVLTMSKSTQVPRSPNTNVLDGGINRSIGSDISKLPKKSLSELHATVMAAWDKLDPLKIERLFAMVTCTAKVYARSGGRRLKNPSVGLRTAQRKGRLWEKVDEWQPTAQFIDNYKNCCLKANTTLGVE